MMTLRHAVASSAVCSCRSVAARAQPLSYRQPLKSSFLGSRVTTASSRGKFLGLSLQTQPSITGRRQVNLRVEANSKTSLGCTKRGTRRARVRTSGFRARSRTPGGRLVLKARRKKGRKILCPASKYRK